MIVCLCVCINIYSCICMCICMFEYISMNIHRCSYEGMYTFTRLLRRKQ